MSPKSQPQLGELIIHGVDRLSPSTVGVDLGVKITTTTRQPIAGREFAVYIGDEEIIRSFTDKAGSYRGRKILDIKKGTHCKIFLVLDDVVVSDADIETVQNRPVEKKKRTRVPKSGGSASVRQPLAPVVENTRSEALEAELRRLAETRRQVEELRTQMAVLAVERTRGDQVRIETRMAEEARGREEKQRAEADTRRQKEELLKVQKVREVEEGVKAEERRKIEELRQAKFTLIGRISEIRKLIQALESQEKYFYFKNTEHRLLCLNTYHVDMVYNAAQAIYLNIQDQVMQLGRLIILFSVNLKSAQQAVGKAEREKLDYEGEIEITQGIIAEALELEGLASRVLAKFKPVVEELRVFLEAGPMSYKAI